jgi:hypothetical protein
MFMFTIRNTAFAALIGLCFFGQTPSANAGGLCLVGCVKAKVEGLPEIAAALETWASIAPLLIKEGSSEVQVIIERMDKLVLDRLNDAEDTYGSILKMTDSAVRDLVDKILVDLDQLSDKILLLADTLMKDVECSSIATSQRLKDVVIGTSSFWDSLKFWSSKETVNIEFFDGSTHSKSVAKGDVFQKASAIHELLGEKIDHASAHEALDKILDVAARRADAAFVFNCKKSTAIDTTEENHLTRKWRSAALDYSRINRLAVLD